MMIQTESTVVPQYPRGTRTPTDTKIQRCSSLFIKWYRICTSCRGSVGFLTRYNEELMEPLVQCQVSQVSMRVARGSGAGGVQTAIASRKQSSLSGKESAQGCLPKRLLGRPD